MSSFMRNLLKNDQKAVKAVLLVMLYITILRAIVCIVQTTRRYVVTGINSLASVVEESGILQVHFRDDFPTHSKVSLIFIVQRVKIQPISTLSASRCIHRFDTGASRCDAQLSIRRLYMQLSPIPT
ncbi:hypothetical protein SCHPADRAFT_907983 [Schizopora paradoxa]|uniref:Uncharacterized protein n=1 Tax=Schizopora paradoxa TaxID=27342 RepID=A0A0H2RBI7_9AGAM|nr:hypothetical protein SCHPADRAFT_907983 [Schizopora paradoxa]